MLPAFGGATVAGKLTEETAMGETELEWGSRSLRAMAVGAPVVGILQIGLGSARPTVGDSNWRPFRSVHGVSGHAFVGAVPFLTAGEMTDNLWLKSAFIASSLGSGWSRINDDAHYLSQVALGWWLAYLAVRSVDDTEKTRKLWSVAPCWTTSGPGLAVHCDY